MTNSYIIKHILLVIFLLLCVRSIAQLKEEKEIIYLIPGQGADERLFKNLQLDTALFKVHHIKYKVPFKEEQMSTYALRLAQQIDTTKAFTLIGVSLGGMIATEINEVLNPKNVIVISSAKCRSELPRQYKFQKAIPLYKIIPKKIIKQSSLIVQPIFEPDRNKEKETCILMLKAKDPTFLKRTIGMIVNWNRISYDPNIIHIHGDKDNTLPIKNVKFDVLVENGSHMIMLTRTDEIKDLILSIMNNDKEQLLKSKYD